MGLSWLGNENVPTPKQLAGTDNHETVFVDESNGEESIELVNHSLTKERENLQERKDIVEAQALPSSTKGDLYYSNQEGLDASRNKVQSRPKIDEKIKAHMVTITEVLQNEDFKPFHAVGKEVYEMLSSTIGYATTNSTSLNAANDLLGSSLKILLEACHGVADKFELSHEAATALDNFKRAERERQELLKKAEMEQADEKREEGVNFLDKAITVGKEDVARVLDRQKKTEEAKTLQLFENRKKELEEDVDREIQELNMMTDNCDGDISKITRSLVTLSESAEVAFKRYTEIDKGLCKALQENRCEQEELMRRLEALKQHQFQLEEEREVRKETQERAEETEQKARQELENWKHQIQELYHKCLAALQVMCEFKDGSTKLIESSIQSKRKEVHDLQEYDILAHRRLRDALAAAAVESKLHIEDCELNLQYLKTQINELKAEKKAKARSNLKLVVAEIMEKLKKYEESYGNQKREKAENEQKFQEYQKDMDELDVRLTALGEEMEAFDDTYRRVQEEVQALWEGDHDGFSSLED